MMSAAKVPSFHPSSTSVARAVCVGGVTKRELLSDFQTSGIELNASGQILFARDEFKTSNTRSVFETVEISVFNLGYAQGATFAQVHEGSAELGLSLCPLELAPHLRLQYLDQPEGYWGHPPSQHRAPPGSITVASAPLGEDDDLPKGFYLRRIKGVLWLRGYRAGAEHVWSPEDHFVFCRPNAA
jgi:hypothetical protein